jgi:hypothetical protein
MLRNMHPNITKENLLDIKIEPIGKNPLRMNVTPWEILPAPRRYIEERWHRVYQGRHRYIESLEGPVLVTANLEAFHRERSAVRPSANRWLSRAEVQDIIADKADRDHVALGKVARRGMHSYRIPTRWRVWFNPTGRINSQTTTSHKYWHRVYATAEASWLYIEVGGEHLRLVAHKQLLEGRGGQERVRGSFGRIKINRQEFLSWLKPEGEIITQD